MRGFPDRATGRGSTYAGFLFARAALTGMLAGCGGSLLFTGATASLRGRGPFVAFAAAKAGLRSVAQSVAREYGPQGVHPVRRVHDDQTFDSAPRRVARHLAPDEAGWRLRRRFAILNFWRPVGGRVRQTPLAVCDARTIDPPDLGKGEADTRLMLDTAGIRTDAVRVEYGNFASGRLVIEALDGGALDYGGMSEIPPVFAAASPIQSFRQIAVINPIPMGVADGLAAFSNGKLDAWAIYGYPIQRVDGEGAHFEEALGFLSGNYIVSVHVDALANPVKSKAIGEYLRIVKRGYAWGATHEAEWSTVIAKDIGVPLEYVRDEFRRKSDMTGADRPDGFAAIWRSRGGHPRVTASAGSGGSRRAVHRAHFVHDLWLLHPAVPRPELAGNYLRAFGAPGSGRRWIDRRPARRARVGHSGTRGSTLGRLFDPISQDSCVFYEQHVLFEDFTGVVLETSEGERIAAALGSKNAAILQNHGILTVGKSVEDAVSGYVSFENACQTQLLAEAAGTIKPTRPEVARHTANQSFGGDPWAYGFRPLWDRVFREQPDFLD